MQVNYTVNPITGEILPPVEDCRYFELGVIQGEHFRRNVVGGDADDVSRWRDRYDNKGIFRTLLASNAADFMDRWRDDGVLYYGDLTFDIDGNKDRANWRDVWQETNALTSYLEATFRIPRMKMQFWFSGGRGVHIAIPARTLGIWPEHSLAKIFASIASNALRQRDLKLLDMSLYGGRHLLRLENSIHQRTGLYKWPFRGDELHLLGNLEALMSCATQTRTVEVPSDGQDEAAKYVFQRLARAVLETPPPMVRPSQRANVDNYDRSRYTCIETLFRDDYQTPEGGRNQIAFILSVHLRQAGFTIEQAESQVLEWASDHCSPPYTSESDLAEWHRTLDNVYREEYQVGCSYIQTHTNLCQEAICPTGQLRIARRSSTPAPHRSTTKAPWSTRPGSSSNTPINGDGTGDGGAASP